MESIIIILLIILILLVIFFRTSVLDRLDRIDHEVSQLKEQAGKVPPIPVQQPTRPAPPPTPTQAPPHERPQTGAPTESRPPMPSAEVYPPAPPVKPPMETEPFVPPVRSRPPTAVPALAATSSSQSAGIPPVAAAPSPAPPQPHTKGDLEKFIGENLVSKIGIAILVLAVGFFVKYAIDNDWIGPVGRVAIGLGCGGILIGIAHALRKGYKAFSSVLVGGGIAILYFSVALAYHQYQLLGQSVAFIVMVVITIFAVLLSLLYDRQELAVIALVGGFVAPFLVSNGSGDYRTLFSYLLILNTGLLVIAYNKTWRLLNLLAFLFTVILYAAWLFMLPYDTTPATYNGGFLFATAFYILFFLINVAYTIRKGKHFTASDFGILLANTCCYFGAGLFLITEIGWVQYRGVFCASMGIFNLAGSYFLFRKQTVDKNVLYLLIGITLTFVSLTAPIQLHGHAITLFWASEMVLLYWLSRKSGMLVIRTASYIVGLAMLGSLALDWVNVYGNDQVLPIIFNKGLMTTLFVSVCCYAMFILQTRVAEGGPAQSDNSAPRYVSLIVGSALLFLGGVLEIIHQFTFYFPGTDLFVLYLILYGFALVYIITLIADRRWFRNHSYSDWIVTICLIVYLVLVAQAYIIQSAILTSGKYKAHYMAHWATALIVAFMFIRVIVRLRTGKTKPYPSAAIVSRWMAIFAVVFLSVEANLLINSLFYSKTMDLDRIGHIYVRTGLPILWGLCSFVMMWIGMAYKFKPLRVLSLVLFTITLLKLFLYDIQDIPVAGKIAAFFCLGVLLLVVSFMYQRLKRIIIEDEKKDHV